MDNSQTLKDTIFGQECDEAITSLLATLNELGLPHTGAEINIRITQNQDARWNTDTGVEEGVIPEPNRGYLNEPPDMEHDPSVDIEPDPIVYNHDE